MSNGFVHSIPVPRLYKTAAKTVRQVTEESASLKQLIYEKKHPNLKGVYALATTTLQNAAQLNEIIRKTQLLFKEPRFDPWLARVLITELLWGKGILKNDSKPVQTILSYENEIRELLKNAVATDDKPKKTAKKPRFIRINTLVKTIEDAVEGFKEDGYTLLSKPKSYKEFLEQLAGLSQWPFPVFIQDFHVHELFAFPRGTHFYDHPGYKSGAIVLQDKASCLPAHLLNPAPGSVVLDMCAAPGMKTTHLAAILQNRGKVYSIERNERRYKTLCEMVQNANAECVQTMHADALTLTSETCPNVEYILVDPSCSGSGMERPDFEDSGGKCAPGRLKRLQSFQVLLLRHALLNFPSVKRVIYSTCSMYPEENEMVVDEILGDIGEAYKLVSVKSLLNNEWISFSSNEYNCKDNCLYARPDVDCSNGFFLAIFERNFDVPLPVFKKASNSEKNTSSTGELLDAGGSTESHKDKKCKKKRKNRRDSNLDDHGLKQCHEIVDNSSEATSEGNVKSVSTDRNKESEEIIDSIDLENNLGSETSRKKHKKKRKTEKTPDAEILMDIESSENSQMHTQVLAESTNENIETENSVKKKKKKKRKNDESEEHQQLDIQIEAPAANTSEDLPKVKKKKKRKQEESATSQPTESQVEVSEVDVAEESSKVKKKKKKSKHISDD